MLPKINPTNTAAWKSLQEHFSEMKNVHMRELFNQIPIAFQNIPFPIVILFLIIPKILSMKKQFNCCFNWLMNAN